VEGQEEIGSEGDRSVWLAVTKKGAQGKRKIGGRKLRREVKIQDNWEWGNKTQGWGPTKPPKRKKKIKIRQDQKGTNITS